MLKSLVVKEIKDLLRDKKILFGMVLVPLIFYIIMGAVFGATTKYSVEQIRETLGSGVKLAVIDLDKGLFSNMLLQYLRKNNVAITKLDSLTDILKLIEMDKYMAVIVIPQGFSKNISSGISGYLKVYVGLTDISITSFSLANAITGIVAGFKEYLSSLIITNTTHLSPKFVANPINIMSNVVLASRYYSMTSIRAFYRQLFMLSIVPMIVIGYAASIAATSIGVEKEEKTLEVLLTLPISRKIIALAKLSGTLIIALMASVSTMIGFYFYMSFYMSGIHSGEGLGENFTVESTSILNVIGISGLALYALSIFLNVMLASTLGLYLGSFGENVRSAQSVVGFIWMLVFLPLYAMFIDFKLSSLAVSIGVSLIPFTAPLITLKSAIIGNMLYSVISIMSTTMILALVVYLMSKRFEGEKLLIGKPGRIRKQTRLSRYKFF